MKNNIKFTHAELYIIFIIGIIFLLRMLGIFIIFPILSIYAVSLQGANEYLIGLTIGIYGITQIIFQLPLGSISDKFGRKPIIIIGLIISAFGSEISAISNHIIGVIIGRALQGSGAIGSVLITLLLDSVREQNQTKAMAIIGIFFGIAFTGSMILGPWIANIVGLHGIFHFITIITGLSIILTYFAIPNPANTSFGRSINITNILYNIKYIITHSKILKLNLNIFCLHTILMLNFIAWPKIIISLGYSNNIHFKIYAIIMLTSVVISFPYIYYANIKNHQQKILTVSTNTLFLSALLIFIMHQNRYLFLLGMQLFFIAFNLIEAVLPSLISKESPKKHKGSSISIYSLGQFFGTGIGGIIGGILLELQGTQLVLLCVLIITIFNITYNKSIKKS